MVNLVPARPRTRLRRPRYAVQDVRILADDVDDRSAPRPVIDDQPVSPYASSGTKRVLDIVLATAALIITAPAQVAIALIVMAESPGAAIFRQVRIGERGRPFVMLKFRTMVDGADPASHRSFVQALLAATDEEDAPHDGLFKMTRDDRITRVGAWLRRTSLDELPQLINVIRGDMSIVGPRPALPYEVEAYRDGQHARLGVRPGVTGLWQVSGRNRLSMRQMCQLDASYVRTCSLRSDIRIILRTPLALLRPRSAA